MGTHACYKTSYKHRVIWQTANNFPDDTFIVSYPKSGNTWTRFLIGNLLFPYSQMDFSKLEDRIPNVNIVGNDNLLKIPRPRYFKSHEYFIPTYKRVIFIVRDPREVVVSYYYHNIKRNFIEPDYSMDDFVDKFINGELDTYGSWQEYVGGWIGAREGDRYEELLSNTERELKKIARFISVNPSKELILDSVEKSNFKNMRQLENKQSNTWYFSKEGRAEMNFVRSGKKNTWSEMLTESQISRIENSFGIIMKKLGYLSAK